jgi:hypothetical protein
MANYAIALLIKGLPNPTNTTSAAPVLFTNAVIDSSTLPSPIPSGVVVLPWLDTSPGSVSGISISSDIRDPAKGAGPITIRLIDVDGALAALFANDPGFESTSFWDCATARFDASATTLKVSGISAIAAPSIVYLEQEALHVTSAVLSGAMSWDLTVTRGACGSVARVHRLNPASYAPADSGLSDTMSVSSRPQFESFTFDAELYLLQVSNGEVLQVVYMRSGFVDGRPTPTNDARFEISMGEITALAADHEIGQGREEVTISHCAQVISQSGAPLNYISPVLFVAPYLRLWLTRYEAEMLFGEPLHQPNNDYADAALVSTLNSTLQQDSLVRYLLKVKIGGYEYIYRVQSIETITSQTSLASDIFVTIRCANEFSQPNASIKDSPYISFDTSLSPSPRYGLNSGYSRAPADMLGEVEEKITAELRVGIRDTICKTALRLLHSDDGSLTTDPVFDVIPGRFGAGFFTSEVNQGTTPANPYTVSETTTALLELDALLPQPFDFVITSKETLQDWLGNICRLHTLLFGALPSNGKLALRLWFSFAQSVSPPTLNPILGDTPSVERLEPLSTISIDMGYNPLDLKPSLPPFVIRSKGAGSKQGAALQKIRMWIKTTNPNFAQFVISQTVWKLSQAFFRNLQGQPEYILATTFLPGAVRTFGDLVLYSDSTALTPTPTGYGISGEFIVSGIDINLEDGRQRLRLLPNLTTRTSHSAGYIAPSLVVISTIVSGPSSGKYSVVCTVDSVAEPTFDITTDHFLIWQDLASASGRVRILNLEQANPMGPLEKQGYLEASAVVTTIANVAGVNKIEVEIDEDWLRSGAYTINDIIKAGSYIVLTDRRFAVSNVENVEIAPIAEQYFDVGNGDDFLKFAPDSSSPPFDNHFSEIGP